MAYGKIIFQFVVGLLLLCSIREEVEAQLVIDNGTSSLDSDHTGGYLGTGVSFADFNGDGLDDLSFGHHTGALKFYAGTGNGFSVVELELETPTAESKGILWADVDNDGDQDLFAAAARVARVEAARMVAARAAGAVARAAAARAAA